MTRHASHVHPVAAIGAIFDAKSLAAEVAEMERLVDLLRRRADLTLDLAALGVDWAARDISPAKVKALVAQRRGVSVAALEGPDCTRPIVEARHEAMFLMRAMRDEKGDPLMTYVAIGLEFGGRDHSTAINGEKKHRVRLGARVG